MGRDHLDWNGITKIHIISVFIEENTSFIDSIHIGKCWWMIDC